MMPPMESTATRTKVLGHHQNPASSTVWAQRAAWCGTNRLKGMLGRAPGEHHCSMAMQGTTMYIHVRYRVFTCNDIEVRRCTNANRL